MQEKIWFERSQICDKTDLEIAQRGCAVKCTGWPQKIGKLSLHYLVKCQRFIHHAIGQWRHWLECVVQQEGGHIEHLM